MNATAPNLKAPVRTAGVRTSRLIYLDNLRVFLTVLVILHHLAITYGASGSWYYEEERTTRGWAIAGTMFTAFNQFYFMGLFFLLAGYFTAGALERKSPRQFLKDRFIRLGIPLVFYVGLISPWLTFLPAKLTRNPNAQFSVHLQNHLPFVNAFSPGPLWFVQALLIFSVCYVAWRKFARKQSNAKAVTLRPVHLVVFGLTLAVSSFTVRQFYPIGKEFLHMQLAFFPQYILLFILGIKFHRENLFLQIPSSWLRPCLTLSVVGLLLIPLQIILSLRTAPDLARFEGGLHWEALTLVLTEAVVCTTVIPVLIIVFRSMFNKETKLSSILANNAYIAFIIHAPVCVIISLAMKDIHFHPVWKFMIASIASLPVTFSLGHLLRKLPGAKRVI